MKFPPQEEVYLIKFACFCQSFLAIKWNSIRGEIVSCQIYSSLPRSQRAGATSVHCGCYLDTPGLGDHWKSNSFYLYYRCELNLTSRLYNHNWDLYSAFKIIVPSVSLGRIQLGIAQHRHKGNWQFSFTGKSEMYSISLLFIINVITNVLHTIIIYSQYISSSGELILALLHICTYSRCIPKISHFVKNVIKW